MKSLLISCLAGAAICGCATVAPTPEILTVKVPVPIKCTVQDQPTPAWEVDKVKAVQGATVYEKMRALVADRLVALSLIDALRVDVASCK
jgi:hypothetical protein